MHRFLLIALLATYMGCNNSEEKKESVKIEQSQSSKTLNPLEENIQRGSVIYTDFCMQCHLANGEGVPASFPPLAGSNWLTEKRSASIHSVKYGQSGEIVVNGLTYNGVMSPMGLSDEEIADVMNYVMSSWGNTLETPVTPDEVAAVEK